MQVRDGRRADEPFCLCARPARVFVCDDGYANFAATGSADSQKMLLASGQLCVNVKYKVASIIPGGNHRAQFRTVVSRLDMHTFAEINMNFWLYSLIAITSFAGIGKLANVSEMQFELSLCWGVPELASPDSTYQCWRTCPTASTYARHWQRSTPIPPGHCHQVASADRNASAIVRTLQKVMGR